MDGSLHLHCAIWFHSEFKSTKPDCFDIDGYHPNISAKAIQSKKAVLKYLCKEDVEPLEYNIDIKQEQQQREAHVKIIGKRLMKGETTLEEEVEKGEIALL